MSPVQRPQDGTGEIKPRVSGGIIMNPSLDESNQTTLRKDSKKFTHLHLHTSYSLLDGAIRPAELMQHVRSLGMDAVAMTDHGNMFGAIEFYKEAVKADVKPIIGLEFYVSPGSRKETKELEKLPDGNNYHLVVLAKNQAGYKNLIRLASRSYTEGFYRKPRIDYELLAEHSEGLIVSSACIAGEIQRKLINGKMDEAMRVAGQLQEIMGPDHFYLEIQKHGIPEEEMAAKGLFEISKKTGIPLVLTNDSHYLRMEDQEAQDILLRINQKKSIEDPLQFGFNDQFYVKSPEEMFSLFPEHPEAFYNTQKISEMIQLDFTFGNPLLPRFDVPPGETLDSHMRKLTMEGLEKRYGGRIPEEVQKRFDFEYKVITGMDFPGYFLIVQDFINWAKSRGVPVGPGRGSAAGSIVAYGLGITDIDPLKYDLLFERFLNPDRKEMPDIDVDFCTERREEVINYVRDKYGEDRVGQIITYGTMAAKAGLKDVARVLNIPFDEANRISKMFPDTLGTSIEEALRESKDLREYSQSGETQKRLFSVARKLEGNTRHTGVHAAGVVIAPEPLEQLVPMATVASKGADKSNSRVLVCQYDMNALTDVGLVKMDFLGLRNLTIIDHAVREIEKRTGKKIDFDTLDMNDEKAYALLQRGDVAGVFQLESSGMREFVLRTKPSRFEDIIALIALYRPGPLDSGMSESFIQRKNGKEKVTYPHPDLEPVLNDTYGVIVYQEQVMLISRIIGGFSPGESDALRKAMGKKKQEIVEKMKVQFIEGATEKGYNSTWAERLYDQMAEFAKYGFNKSHSAAYAMIVYRTAYLKANYPTEYMTAVLDSEIEKTDRLVFYINACRDMGIQILGPDINESNLKFKATGEKSIRFGLNAVKNVGTGAVHSIIEQREKEGGSFDSITRFMELVDLRLCNKRTVESLISAGGFDSMGYTRKALHAGIEALFSHAGSVQKDRELGQESLFGGLSSSGGPSSGASEDIVPRGEHISEYPPEDKLRMEKEVLGFYFSGHPLDRFARTLKSIKSRSLIDIKERAKSGEKVSFAAVITEKQVRMTKTNREMARLTLEDRTSSVSAMVFPAALEKIKEDLISETPLMLRATVERNEDTQTAQLTIDSAKPITQESLEEKLERSLHLTIESQKISSELVQKMRQMMMTNRGPVTVFFHLVNKENPDDRTVIKAHQSFGINYSREFIQDLQMLDEVQDIFLTVGNQMRKISS